MPRAPKLHWESSRGKWKVVYRGKKFRFDGGTGKSDREAKKTAETQWRRIKGDLDGNVVAFKDKPHQALYDRAINQWQQVLHWANEHRDQSNVTRAEEALLRLKRQYALSAPPALSQADFPLLSGAKSWHAQESPYLPNALPVDVLEDDPFGVRPGLEAIWSDRLAWTGRRAGVVETEDSLEANVQAFLEGKRSEVEAGELSAGRLGFLRNHLDVAMEFVGRGSAVNAIDGTTLYGFRQLLLKRRTAGDYSAHTARDMLATFKQFIRWLASNTDKLEHLPKNIDEKSMSIAVPRLKAKTLTIEQVQTLLQQSTERTRLYLLLALNCAMTQIDISDLKPDEVDWNLGVIRRKRSKTQNCENVPEVSYPLWPATLELLKQERSKSSDNVLVSKDGMRLRTDVLLETGKVRKTDAIRLALRHLSKKTKIVFSMKTLKKTSASLLRNDSRFKGIESLFLDHAPSTVAERHYTALPQDLLNEAVTWLGRELKVVPSDQGSPT